MTTVVRKHGLIQTHNGSRLKMSTRVVPIAHYGARRRDAMGGEHACYARRAATIHAQDDDGGVWAVNHVGAPRACSRYARGVIPV